MSIVLNIASNIAFNKAVYEKFFAESYGAGEDFESFVLSINGKEYTFGDVDIRSKRLIFAPPLVSFSRRKNIIVTDVNGGDTVVEQWGIQGYEITIDGIVVDMKKHRFPGDKIKELHELFALNQTAIVKSGTIFESVGVKEFYITDFNLRGVPGYEDTWEYQLRALSVKPLQFTLSA
ncbi:MAG: hypothetical protein K2Q03_05730 [Sphingobacteriaceae bacterium]|nr:hypothetical protein [Sphingobacteriaceae bacterium]